MPTKEIQFTVNLLQIDNVILSLVSDQDDEIISESTTEVCPNDDYSDMPLSKVVKILVGSSLIQADATGDIDLALSDEHPVLGMTDEEVKVMFLEALATHENL